MPENCNFLRPNISKRTPPLESGHDVRPTDIGDSDGGRSSVDCDELVGIKTQFDDVVDESNQRRQRKRSDEQRHETKLHHCSTTERWLLDSPKVR